MALSTQLPFPYEIRGWDAGGDQFNLSIGVNGYRFNICVSLDNFANSPKAAADFRDFLQKIEADEDPDGEEHVWDFSERIANGYVPQFERLAPPLMYTGKVTLADLAPRGVFETEYRVQDEVAFPGELTPRIIDSPSCPEWDMRSVQSSFPLFSPSEIEVRLSKPTAFEEIIPREVYAHGRRVFYKSCWSPGDAVPEINKYCILAAHTDLRTSKLFGIVVDRQGQSSGLLYHWISTKRDGTLTSALSLGASLEMRARWVAQVRETVTALHELGIVWGDAKPDNVLINENDDAVVIDLEGGTTRGWVDHDAAESIEGDLQGLKRLEHFVLQ